MKKGESIRDTVQTIDAFGVDAFVVRHGSSGVPAQVAGWTDAAVVNGGDGWHEHPTQALLDAYTIRAHRGSLDGLRIAIVGDIKHSRVARSRRRWPSPRSALGHARRRRRRSCRRRSRAGR